MRYDEFDAEIHGPSTGPSAARPLIGQTIGNYLVTQKLGEGGMGSVYLAEHPTIGKKVALKVLHAEFSTNTEVVGAFFNEAKAVNDIGHPNIVDIVDFGVIQTGRAAASSSSTSSWSTWRARRSSQLIRAEAPLPPERALTIALQVADALVGVAPVPASSTAISSPTTSSSIQRGRERDFVKLLDFGIAKLHRRRARLAAARAPASCSARPRTCRPSNAKAARNVDHRTDIYALGICLYEMLAGRVPFIGEGYGEILVQHLTQTPIAAVAVSG